MRFKSLNQFQDAAASRATKGRARLIVLLRFSCSQDVNRLRAEQFSRFLEQAAIGWTEQPVIADFDEMIWQDVLKKTTDELFGWDGREFDLIGG